MPVSSIQISVDADGKLARLMAELNLERPYVLRIALSKGVFHFQGEPPEVKSHEKGREVPINTLCPGDSYVIVKHCIIQKIKQVPEEKKIDGLIKRCLHYGIELMYEEVTSLSELDNYLLFLTDNIGNAKSVSEAGTKRMMDLLGI